MKGKIIKINSNLGFIEYADVKSVFYVYKNYKDNKIGGKINFELISKSVERTNQIFNNVINLKSNEFFDKIDVVIEIRPTTKTSIENYKLLFIHINSLKNNIKTKDKIDNSELISETESRIIGVY